MEEDEILCKSCNNKVFFHDSGYVFCNWCDQESLSELESKPSHGGLETPSPSKRARQKRRNCKACGGKKLRFAPGEYYCKCNGKLCDFVKAVRKRNESCGKTKSNSPNTCVGATKFQTDRTISEAVIKNKQLHSDAEIVETHRKSHDSKVPELLKDNPTLVLSRIKDTTVKRKSRCVDANDDIVLEGNLILSKLEDKDERFLNKDKYSTVLSKDGQFLNKDKYSTVLSKDDPFLNKDKDDSVLIKKEYKDDSILNKVKNKVYSFLSKLEDKDNSALRKIVDEDESVLSRIENEVELLLGRIRQEEASCEASANIAEASGSKKLSKSHESEKVAQSSNSRRRKRRLEKGFDEETKNISVENEDLYSSSGKQRKRTSESLINKENNQEVPRRECSRISAEETKKKRDSLKEQHKSSSTENQGEVAEQEETLRLSSEDKMKNREQRKRRTSERRNSLRSSDCNPEDEETALELPFEDRLKKQDSSTISLKQHHKRRPTENQDEVCKQEESSEDKMKKQDSSKEQYKRRTSERRHSLRSSECNPEDEETALELPFEDRLKKQDSSTISLKQHHKRRPTENQDEVCQQEESSEDKKKKQDSSKEQYKRRTSERRHSLRLRGCNPEEQEPALELTFEDRMKKQDSPTISLKEQHKSRSTENQDEDCKQKESPRLASEDKMKKQDSSKELRPSERLHSLSECNLENQETDLQLSFEDRLKEQVSSKEDTTSASNKTDLEMENRSNQAPRLSLEEEKKLPKIKNRKKRVLENKLSEESGACEETSKLSKNERRKEKHSKSNKNEETKLIKESRLNEESQRIESSKIPKEQKQGKIHSDGKKKEEMDELKKRLSEGKSNEESETKKFLESSTHEDSNREESTKLPKKQEEKRLLSQSKTKEESNLEIEEQKKGRRNEESEAKQISEISTHEESNLEESSTFSTKETLKVNQSENSDLEEETSSYGEVKQFTESEESNREESLLTSKNESKKQIEENNEEMFASGDSSKQKRKKRFSESSREESNRERRIKQFAESEESNREESVMLSKKESRKELVEEMSTSGGSSKQKRKKLISESLPCEESNRERRIKQFTESEEGNREESVILSKNERENKEVEENDEEMSTSGRSSIQERTKRISESSREESNHERRIKQFAESEESYREESVMPSKTESKKEFVEEMSTSGSSKQKRKKLISESLPLEESNRKRRIKQFTESEESVNLSKNDRENKHLEEKNEEMSTSGRSSKPKRKKQISESFTREESNCERRIKEFAEIEGGNCEESAIPSKNERRKKLLEEMPTSGVSSRQKREKWFPESCTREESNRERIKQFSESEESNREESLLPSKNESKKQIEENNEEMFASGGSSNQRRKKRISESLPREESNRERRIKQFTDSEESYREESVMPSKTESRKEFVEEMSTSGSSKRKRKKLISESLPLEESNRERRIKQFTESEESVNLSKNERENKHLEEKNEEMTTSGRSSKPIRKKQISESFTREESNCERRIKEFTESEGSNCGESVIPSKNERRKKLLEEMPTSGVSSRQKRKKWIPESCSREENHCERIKQFSESEESVMPSKNEERKKLVLEMATSVDSLIRERKNQISESYTAEESNRERRVKQFAESEESEMSSKNERRKKLIEETATSVDSSMQERKKRISESCTREESNREESSKRSTEETRKKKTSESLFENYASNLEEEAQASPQISVTQISECSEGTLRLRTNEKRKKKSWKRCPPEKNVEVLLQSEDLFSTEEITSEEAEAIISQQVVGDGNAMKKSTENPLKSVELKGDEAIAADEEIHPSKRNESASSTIIQDTPDVSSCDECSEMGIALYSLAAKENSCAKDAGELEDYSVINECTPENLVPPQTCPRANLASRSFSDLLIPNTHLNDTLCSGELKSTLRSGELNDTLCSGELNNTLCSGELNNTLCSGELNKTLCAAELQNDTFSESPEKSTRIAANPSSDLQNSTNLTQTTPISSRKLRSTEGRSEIQAEPSNISVLPEIESAIPEVISGSFADGLLENFTLAPPVENEVDSSVRNFTHRLIQNLAKTPQRSPSIRLATPKVEGERIRFHSITITPGTPRSAISPPDGTEVKSEVNTSFERKSRRGRCKEELESSYFESIEESNIRECDEILANFDELFIPEILASRAVKEKVDGGSRRSADNEENNNLEKQNNSNNLDSNSILPDAASIFTSTPIVNKVKISGSDWSNYSLTPSARRMVRTRIKQKMSEESRESSHQVQENRTGLEESIPVQSEVETQSVTKSSSDKVQENLRGIEENRDKQMEAAFPLQTEVETQSVTTSRGRKHSTSENSDNIPLGLRLRLKKNLPLAMPSSKKELKEKSSEESDLNKTLKAQEMFSSEEQQPLALRVRPKRNLSLNKKSYAQPNAQQNSSSEEFDLQSSQNIKILRQISPNKIIPARSTKRRESKNFSQQSFADSTKEESSIKRTEEIIPNLRPRRRLSKNIPEECSPLSEDKIQRPRRSRLRKNMSEEKEVDANEEHSSLRLPDDSGQSIKRRLRKNTSKEKEAVEEPSSVKLLEDIIPKPSRRRGLYKNMSEEKDTIEKQPEDPGPSIERQLDKNIFEEKEAEVTKEHSSVKQPEDPGLSIKRRLGKNIFEEKEAEAIKEDSSVKQPEDPGLSIERQLDKMFSEETEAEGTKEHSSVKQPEDPGLSIERQLDKIFFEENEAEGTKEHSSLKQPEDPAPMKRRLNKNISGEKEAEATEEHSSVKRSEDKIPQPSRRTQLSKYMTEEKEADGTEEEFFVKLREESVPSIERRLGKNMSEEKEADVTEERSSVKQPEDPTPMKRRINKNISGEKEAEEEEHSSMKRSEDKIPQPSRRRQLGKNMTEEKEADVTEEEFSVKLGEESVPSIKRRLSKNVSEEKEADATEEEFSVKLREESVPSIKKRLNKNISGEKEAEATEEHSSVERSEDKNPQTSRRRQLSKNMTEEKEADATEEEFSVKLLEESVPPIKRRLGKNMFEEKEADASEEHSSMKQLEDPAPSMKRRLNKNISGEKEAEAIIERSSMKRSEDKNPQPSRRRQFSKNMSEEKEADASEEQSSVKQLKDPAPSIKRRLNKNISEENEAEATEEHSSVKRSEDKNPQPSRRRQLSTNMTEEKEADAIDEEFSVKLESVPSIKRRLSKNVSEEKEASAIEGHSSVKQTEDPGPSIKRRLGKNVSEDKEAEALKLPEDIIPESSRRRRISKTLTEEKEADVAEEEFSVKLREESVPSIKRRLSKNMSEEKEESSIEEHSSVKQTEDPGPSIKRRLGKNVCEDKEAEAMKLPEDIIQESSRRRRIGKTLIEEKEADVTEEEFSVKQREESVEEFSVKLREESVPSIKRRLGENVSEEREADASSVKSVSLAFEEQSTMKPLEDRPGPSTKRHSVATERRHLKALKEIEVEENPEDNISASMEIQVNSNHLSSMPSEKNLTPLRRKRRRGSSKESEGLSADNSEPPPRKILRRRNTYAGQENCNSPQLRTHFSSDDEDLYKPERDSSSTTWSPIEEERKGGKRPTKKAVKLKKPRRRAEARNTKITKITTWDCYNYVLLGLVKEMIALGANEKLRDVVKVLWFKYLKKIEVLHDDPTKPPKLQLLNSHIDAEILYGMSRDSEANESPDENSQKKGRSIHNKSLGSFSYTSKSKKLHYSSFAKRQLKKLMPSKEVLNESLGSAESPKRLVTWKDVTYAQHHPALALTKSKLYGIIYLALLITEDEIKLGDILRFIQEGGLSFNKLQHFFPENIHKSALSPYSLNMQSPIISSEGLRNLTGKLAEFIGVESYIPAVNFYKTVERYCEELNLPDELVQYIHKLIYKTKPKMKLKKPLSTLPNYDARAISFIIFGLKILLGLDGATEFELSKTATTLGSNAFNFKDWFEHLYNRRLFINRHHFPSYFKSTTGAAELPGLYTNYVRKIGLEDTAQFHNLKLLEMHLGRYPRGETETYEFDRSLTPQRNFVRKFGKTEILLSDFNDRSIRYLHDPDVYKDYKVKIKHRGVHENIEFLPFAKYDYSFGPTKLNCTFGEEHDVIADAERIDSHKILDKYNRYHKPSFEKSERQFETSQGAKKKITIYNPAERFWIHLANFKGMTNEAYNEYFNSLPDTFQQIVQECAQIIQQSTRDILTEYSTLETNICDIEKLKHFGSNEKVTLPLFVKNNINQW